MQELNTNALKEYQEYRPEKNAKALCFAPSSSMNFSQEGMVKVCCFNESHPIGKYPKQSLQEIWFGEKAEKLRNYMDEFDASHGCEFCVHQINARNFAATKAIDLDSFKPKKGGFKKLFSKNKFNEFPKVFEFEIDNICNLECVMCNGKFSSLIRKNRENLPPIKSPYDQSFIEQLKPFIPHLKEAKFLGGEPFLTPLYFQIWDLIIEKNPTCEVYITTNGTVLTQKVKEYLNKLKPHLVLSIDSVVKETYQEIRLNANFEKVMENIQYFREKTKEWQTSLSFAVCPMPLNYKELPKIVDFCNKKNISIHFNTVIDPIYLSMESLSFEEVNSIILDLEEFIKLEKRNLLKRNLRNISHLLNGLKSIKTTKKDCVSQFKQLKNEFNSSNNHLAPYYFGLQESIYFLTGSENLQRHIKKQDQRLKEFISNHNQEEIKRWFFEIIEGYLWQLNPKPNASKIMSCLDLAFENTKKDAQQEVLIRMLGFKLFSMINIIQNFEGDSILLVRKYFDEFMD